MPELPEVETIARELRPALIGRTITDAWCDWPNQIKNPAPADFVARLRGRRVLSVERRAKWIVVALTGQQGAAAVDDQAVLAIQVKMTGQLDTVALTAPRDKHVHIVLSLDDGTELRLHDTRKFARMGLYKRDEAGHVLGAGEGADLFADFGPEPLADDFTLWHFRHRLRQRRARLKPLLMDQGFVAGVGNIYADEALWRARLHPLRSGAGLNPRQERELYEALRAVLGEAIERRGSSVDSYRAPAGAGSMQHFLNAYGRTGLPCPRCGRPIRRIVVGARSTHFCSWCQRLPARERSAATSRVLAGMR